jgi:hypothetical protein
VSSELDRQNGTARSVPLFLRFAQISRANLDLSSGGVARTIATASTTAIVSPSPFILVTAFIHWPKFSAPLAGLYRLVSRCGPHTRNQSFICLDFLR